MNLRPKPAIGGLNLPGSFPSMSRTPAEPADDQYLFQVGNIFRNTSNKPRVQKGETPQKHMFKLSKLSLKSILKVWMNLYQNPHIGFHVFWWILIHIFVSISTTKMMRCVVSAEAQGFNFTVDPFTFEVPELLGEAQIRSWWIPYVGNDHISIHGAPLKVPGTRWFSSLLGGICDRSG